MRDRIRATGDIRDWQTRAAQVEARARETARRLSLVAGQVATTENEVARIHEEIARNAVSVTAAEAAEHALRARRFAELERLAQQRWAAVADGTAGQASPATAESLLS